MNVPTMRLDRVTALKKAAAYGRAVRRSRDPVAAAAEAGYQALADGRTLLDLNMAVAAGGWDARGLPRFAVARADRREVRFHLDGRSMVFDASSGRGGGRPGPSLRRTVPLGVMPPLGVTVSLYRWARGLVPMVPADVAEEGRRNARFPGQRRQFILWEAVWEPTPPRDPILLEHVAGSLYAVLAQWELTELERALMAGSLYGTPST